MKLENELKALAEVAKNVFELLDSENWSVLAISEAADELRTATSRADRALADIPETAGSELESKLAVALKRSARKDEMIAALKTGNTDALDLLTEWINSPTVISYDSPEWHRLNDLTLQLLDHQFMRGLTREEMAELPRDGWIHKTGDLKWSYDRAWSVNREWHEKMTIAGMVGLEKPWNDLYIICNG